MRDTLRSEILKIKEHRRVLLGPYLNFLFENRETMRYQVQEMMRVEGIEKEEAIQHEIKTYNQLVPGKDELKATLLIEFEDEATRRVKLKELVGLENSIELSTPAGSARAMFDSEQVEPEKLSSVQYVTFSLTAEIGDSIRAKNAVTLKVSHPACTYEVDLNSDQVAALADDLSS